MGKIEKIIEDLIYEYLCLISLQIDKRKPITELAPFRKVMQRKAEQEILDLIEKCFSEHEECPFIIQAIDQDEYKGSCLTRGGDCTRWIDNFQGCIYYKDMMLWVNRTLDKLRGEQ